MKWLIYMLSMLAIVIIVVFLNHISAGNLSGIGLGDFIIKIFGYMLISNILRDNIWKEK